MPLGVGLRKRQEAAFAGSGDLGADEDGLSFLRLLHMLASSHQFQSIGAVSVGFTRDLGGISSPPATISAF